MGLNIFKVACSNRYIYLKPNIYLTAGLPSMRIMVNKKIGNLKTRHWKPVDSAIFLFRLVV